MQTRRFSKILLFFTAALGMSSIYGRQTLEEAKLRVKEGYKTPSYGTNFPSEQLFSIADIKRKTHKITQSKALRITRSGTYDPRNEIAGSPMFHVLASTVIIDLNGQVITKNVNAAVEVRCVAIEVGRAPVHGDYALASQPQNVIIRNGTIDNFDIGIVVHKGVKSVRFEDVTFSRSPVGVALMGGAGADEEIVSCSFHNVKVIGGKLEDSAALTWAKNKVENATWGAMTYAEAETQNFGYGDNSFVAMTDPVTNVEALGAYYGIAVRHANNLLLSNVTVDSLGYDAAESSTVTHGIDIENSHNVFLEGVHSSHNVSTHMVKGCHLKDCTSVALTACSFNNNSATFFDTNATSHRGAYGLHLESVNASSLNGIACNKNEADNTGDATPANARAYGILWETGNALELKAVECNHNEGNAGFCYGMQLDTTESVAMDDIVADYNHGTGGNITAGFGAGDVAANSGATGISLSTSVKSITMSNVATNANYGSTVAGLRVQAGQGVTLRNFNSDYSNGSGAVIGLSFETSIQSLDCEKVSVVSNTSTGGAVKAIAATAAQSTNFDGVVCNYNTSTGGAVTVLDFATSAKTVTLKNVLASNNSSNGAVGGLAVAEGQSIVLNGVQFNSNTGAAASQILDFTGSIAALNMSNVTVNSNSLSAGALQGIQLDDAADVSMSNVAVNGNSTAGAAMTGVQFKITGNTVTNSIDLVGLTIDGNSTDTEAVKALVLAAGRNVSMRDCSMSDNYQSGTGTSAVMGMDLTTSIRSLTMNNVVVNNNVATGTAPAHGIKLADAVAVSMDGVIVNNTTSAQGAVLGIEFSGTAKSCDIQNLIVNHTNSTTAALNISSAAADGIKFTGAAENIALAHASVSHTMSSATGGGTVTEGAVHGLSFATSVKSLEVVDAIFNSNEGAAVHGMLVTASDNVTFKDVSADQNSGSGAVYGMEFATSVSALDMKNMTANNNSSSGTTVHGLKLTDAVAVSIDGGDVNNNSSAGGVATGIQFVLVGNTSTDSIDLRNLSVDNTTATSAAAAVGIRIKSGENLVFNNVTANHTKSTNATPGAVQGISLEVSAKSVEMDDVVLNANVGAATHGLLVMNAQNFSLNNVAADQNSGTTAVFGLDFQINASTSNAIDMHNVSANANAASGGAAGGIRINTGVAVIMEDIAANYNQATGGEAVGIEVLTSASALDIRNASASNNASVDNIATGVRVVAGNAVSFDGVSANYNSGVTQDAVNAKTNGYTIRGIHFKISLQSAHLDNLVCDSNFGGDQGVGLHVEGPASVAMSNVSASKNDGDDRAYGIFLDGQTTPGSNVMLVGALLNGNTASDADTAMDAVDTTATVSKHMPVNNADTVAGFDTLEGGFGLYVHDIDSCQFENVEASRNEGMRAGGVYARSCNDCTLRKCKTSFQQADGTFFFGADPFNGLTSTAVEIPDLQAVTFFGDTTITHKVNLVQVTTDFLAALRGIKYLHDIDDYEPVEPAVYADIKKLAGSQLLLRAILAQFRRFSTAVGVHLHDCVNCVLEDHTAVGNKSLKDSAFGIGISGTAEGHLMVRAKCSGNEAWADSAVAATGDIDISAVLPFWTFLNTVQLTEEAPVLPKAGAVDPLVGTITSAMIGYGLEDENQPGYVASADPNNDLLRIVQADRLAIALNVLPVNEDAYDGKFEEFGPAVGGEAAGIVVGDAASNIEISACDCANNKAHAGRAFGLMQDVTTSLLAKDNRFYQTSSNDLGYTFGVAEFTLQSNSIHVGNVMFSNACGDFLNANFLVPFDPSDHPNIFFPVKIGYNGDVGNFANASPFDNLAVHFVAAKQADPYLGAGIAGATNLWETSTWVSA